MLSPLPKAATMLMPARDEMAKSDFLDIMKRMKWGGGERKRESVGGSCSKTD